jgi:hypothetical protein
MQFQRHDPSYCPEQLSQKAQRGPHRFLYSLRNKLLDLFYRHKKICVFTRVISDDRKESRVISSIWSLLAPDHPSASGPASSHAFTRNCLKRTISSTVASCIELRATDYTRARCVKSLLAFSLLLK